MAPTKLYCSYASVGEFITLNPPPTLTWGSSNKSGVTGQRLGPGVGFSLLVQYGNPCCRHPSLRFAAPLPDAVNPHLLIGTHHPAHLVN